MKSFLNCKQLFFSLLLLLLGSTLYAQTVVDPSVQDPDYNARKLALARPNTGSQVNADIVPTCHTDNGCFIPFDDTYTEIPRNDDGFFGPIALPFTFNLYGTNYSQVWINTNGNLTFTNGLTDFVPSGFPIGEPMVAAFWSDVDTRSTASGAIHYQLSATHLIVTWDHVGYFPSLADKVNTFQIIIGTQGDPLIGTGNNVKLNYQEMQWAIAPATQLNGPTTVGINKGDVASYIQVGRFEKENCDYDGPIGETDGIGYLEYQCLGFNATNLTNLPPSVSGLPANNTIELSVGETVSLTPQFIGPEPGQSVTTEVNDQNLCNVSASITNGELSSVDLTITGASCNVGTHTIVLTATDNGEPQQTTTVTLTVIVHQPATNTPPAFNYTTTPADGTEINVQTGQPVSFQIEALDTDEGDNVVLTASVVPAGGVLTPSLPADGNPVSTQFSWTPAAGDVGTYALQFTATDKDGATAITSVIISVSSVSECDPTFASYIRVTPRATVRGQALHTIYLGYGLQRVLLTALPKGGVAPYTYRWGNGKQSASRMVSPETTTRYNVAITDGGGCVSYDNVVIQVVDVRCPNNPGHIFICYEGETRQVPEDEVQQWLDMGATLGSCDAGPYIVASEAPADERVAAPNLKAGSAPDSHLLTVYPNPATTVVNLNWKGKWNNDAKVMISDLAGKVLSAKALTSSSQQISVGSLVNGVYVAKLVIAGNVVATARFVINR